MDEFNHPTPHTGGWRRRGTTVVLDDPFAVDPGQAEVSGDVSKVPPGGREQSRLLASFFGSGAAGARRRMADFRVPPGLTRTSLLWYRDVVVPGVFADPRKATPQARLVQTLRLRLIGRALRAGGLDPELAASVGPCAEVPVPPSARPRLLRRGSVSPAVRDAQRRLNHFHRSEVAAGRAGLVDAPLVEDCIFGRRTFNAVLSFQRQVFPGQPSEHDGKIGPKTWVELDRGGTSPPAAPPPPSPALPGPHPTPRPCCMLDPPSLRDASTIGGHNDLGGIVYTGKAGFVDVGHVRDVVDLTAFVYQEIHRAGGASGTRIRTTEGEARLISRVPAAEWLEVARSIAFDDALGHEIVTYSDGVGPCRLAPFSAGGHNSSFSPEDLCSNFLGTLVAARALAAGGTFTTEADRALQSLLVTLDAQSLAETRRAFALIDGRWVDSSLGIFNNCYLKRRNFTRDPFKAGHRSDTPTPAFVTAAFTHTSTYEYTHRRGFTRVDFATEIATIRTDARSRYGADFDKP